MFLINNVLAQNPGSDTIVIQKKLEKMKKEMNLTQEQLNSLKPILSNSYQQTEMFKRNQTIFKDIEEQNNQSTDNEISKVLTPEQYRQYIQKKEKNKQMKRDLRIKEKMAFYRQELKLTEQQYSNLKNLIEQNSIRKETMKKDFKNNDEMLKQEMQKVRKDFQEQLKNILTKEQLEKYKNLYNTSKP